MKKVLIITLIACMVIGTLSACGASSKSAAAKVENAAQTEANNSGSSGKTEASSKTESAGGSSNAIYKESGSELTYFLSALMDPEKAFNDAIGETEITDMDIMNAQMARVLPNLELLTLPQYDMLSAEDLPKKEGKLMMAGYDGIREKSGNKIKFSASYTFPEDSGINKKGDRYAEKGTLDMATNILVMESTTERDGKMISRAVFEAVILEDGTNIVQYLNVGKMMEDYKKSTNAVFKRYNKNEYLAITAEFEGDMDFKYDSIAGKGDLQPEAMAKNYMITRKFTVKDGKVDISK